MHLWNFFQHHSILSWSVLEDPYSLYAILSFFIYYLFIYAVSSKEFAWNGLVLVYNPTSSLDNIIILPIVQLTNGWKSFALYFFQWIDGPSVHAKGRGQYFWKLLSCWGYCFYPHLDCYIFAANRLDQLPFTALTPYFAAKWSSR